MADITEYYTAGAAQAVLGVTWNQLQTLVDNGSVRRYLPAGKKRHVYNREDVDRLAHTRRDTEKIRIIGKEDLDDNNPGRTPFDSKRSGAFLAGR